MIEKKYPRTFKAKKDAYEKANKERVLNDIMVDNLPILSGLSVHLFPGMRTHIMIHGRAGLDLVHHVSRGNRRFVLIKNPDADLRGFIVELVRMTPSAVRGESMLEILGIDRFLADRVYIPEDRRGLYLNEAQALRFANGRIIKDREFIGE